MKLGKIFGAILTGAVLLTACEKEVDLGPAKLQVNPVELNLSATDPGTEITILATRDWLVSSDIPEWVALSAETGTASTEEKKITVSVTENLGYNRTATISFTTGFNRSTLVINQAGPGGEVDNGDGSKNNPYNVTGAIEYVKSLGSNVESDSYVYVTGIISAISEEYTTQYGNATFTISDDGTTTGEQFTAYRVLYLGNAKFTSNDTQIKVGDNVVLYAKIYYYGGKTPETVQGSSFLFSLNGVDKGGDEGGSGSSVDPAGTGSADDPFNVAAAIAKAKETGETVTTDEYYIKGIISSNPEISTQYDNCSFKMVDEDGGEEFYAFRIKSFNGTVSWNADDPIAKGDEVVIKAKIVNYKSNTPETDAGGCLVLWNGKTSFDGGDTPGGDDTASGSGTEADPYNPAAAYAAAAALDANEITENDVWIKGKISFVKFYFSSDYGTATFNLSNDGTTSGTQFTCYSVYYKAHEQKWVEGDTQIAVGDEVLVCAKLTNYVGDSGVSTPETASKKGYVASITSGGDTPSDEAGTESNPFTVAQAIAKCKETGETKTGKEYYVKGIISGTPEIAITDSYNNATFDMVDSATDTEKFKAFRIKSFNGGDFAATDKLNENDEVVVVGTLVNYKGDTPETAEANVSRLVSVNGKTSFDEGGDTPGGDDTPTGDGIVIDFSTKGYANGTKYTTTVQDGVTVTFGDGANDGKYYNTGNAMRIYGNGYVQVSAEKNITKIIYTWDGSSTNDSNGATGKPDSTFPATASTGTYDQASCTWTGSATSVKLTRGSGSGHWRLQKVEVYLEGGGDSGDDTPDTPETNLPVNDGLTEDTAFTVQDAIYVAKNVADGKEYYITAVVGKNIQIKNGAATLELVDGTTSEALSVDKMKSFGGEDFTGNEPIAWLDEVVIKGKVTTLTGQLPVVTDAVLIKWNGETSFGGEDEPDEPVVTAATVASITAQIPATATSNSRADYEATLTGAVVSYVNGSNIYLEDESGAILLYLAESGLEAGDVISGKVSGQGYYYNGLPEIVSIGTEYTKTSGGNIPETGMTIAALLADYEANFSRRIKITGVTVTDAIADGDRNGKILQGNSEIAVYASLNNKGLVLAEGATGDLIAFPTVYEKNGTKTYQLSYWSNDLFTETGGGDSGDDTGDDTGEEKTVTIDFASMGLENGVKYEEFYSDNQQVWIKFGDGSSDGKYYNTGTGIRIYGGGYCQVGSESAITKIVYTFADTNLPTPSSYAPAADSYSVDTGAYDVDTYTWTGSATSVKLQRGTGSGHWRLQKVEVTYN